MKEITKELTVYFFRYKEKHFIVLFSSNQGWGCLFIKKKFLLVKKNEIYFYAYKVSIKSFVSLLTTFFFSFYKNYSQYLKIKGMGFKIICSNSNLLYKLNYSHRILYIFSSNIRLTYFNRQLFKIEGRSLWKLKNIVYSLCNLRKLNTYKKKGLYVKGSIITLKISSKKLKS